MERGEIWLVNFAPQIGAEIQKNRPALVVSAQGLMPLATRIVVPFRDRKPHQSTADCSQVKSFDKARFLHKIGEVSHTELQSLLESLALCLGM